LDAIALYLDPGASVDQLANLPCVIAHKLYGQLAEPFQVIVVDVVLVVLGEAIDEHGSRFRSIKDDCPKAAGPSLSWPWKSLLDDAAAEIGVNQSLLGSKDRLTKRFVIDPLLS
jgi:hypothetical protein